MTQPTIDHPGLGTAEAAMGPTADADGPGSTLYRVFDLWGLTRSRWIQYLALLITAAFVVLEGRYNFDLLNTLVDPQASRDTVQTLSDRGKFLSALGISWACGRVLLEKIRPAVIGVALFSALATGAYHGLDHVYTTVIRELPAEVKMKGYSLFSYRRDLLTGRL